jgi:hypothetical protein
MKDLFVPYEQSLQLKELGFDEPCFGIWIGRGSKYDVMYVAKQEDAWMAEQNDGILAPIFAQAFEFFREKYNLFGQVNIHTYFIYDISTPEIIKEYDKLTKTYKETELACLIKLIEITKNKI